MPLTFTKSAEPDRGAVINHHTVFHGSEVFGTLHQVGHGFPNSGQWVWYTPCRRGPPYRGSVATFEEAKGVLERCREAWLERDGVNPQRGG